MPHALTRGRTLSRERRSHALVQSMNRLRILTMEGSRSIRLPGIILVGLWWAAVVSSPAHEVQDEPGVVLRLVHPERQAQAVLKLFEGTRAAHPAAALAAWKPATSDPNQCGKPLEAAISFFNPEMVREWSSLHEARFSLGLAPEKSTPRWHLVVPGDDGSLVALVTALRLTSGGTDPPVGRARISVERLGAPGGPVAAQIAGALALASSRTILERLIETDLRDGYQKKSAESLTSGGKPLLEQLGSGLCFRLEPGRLGPPVESSLLLRRFLEAARAIDCRAVDGILALEDDVLGVELATEFMPGRASPLGDEKVDTIDQDWLSWVPAKETFGFLAFAFGHSPAYWNLVFDVADRVDRVDPARRDLAPLRTRLNLLATTAGTRLEADLWPHLRGLTAALLTNPDDPARPGRAFLTLHMDDEHSAQQASDQVIPRLCGLLSGSILKPNHGDSKVAKTTSKASPPRQLGRVSGRSLEVARRGRTVLVAWGDGTLATVLRAHEHPEESAEKRLVAAWDGESERPNRV